ncbi:MAG TPA: hypothetical protein VKU44_06930, partial [Terriglobia bacterium]|nr:hypothetical protein [Terriglobia bacterium]
VWPAAATWPGRLLAGLMDGLFRLTDLPHLPHWLSYRVASPPDWVAWGVALSLAAAAVWLGRRPWIFRLSLAAAGMFTALIALHPFAPRLAKGTLEVTALDCGAGEATWVVLPDRTTILIGAGGSPTGFPPSALARRRWDPGEDIVSAYLWSRGVKKVDVLVAPSTAGNALAGFQAIMANFQVGEFWYASIPPTAPGRSAARRATMPPPALDALVAGAVERSIPVRALAAGSEMALGRSSVRALGADALRISSGGASVVVAGEIENQTESSLKDLSETPLASQVLEVARRVPASSPSPEFLSRVAPKVAVVVADRENPHTLPTVEMLDHLKAIGARLARTDRDGAVTVEIGASSVEVHGFGVGSALQ